MYSLELLHLCYSNEYTHHTITVQIKKLSYIITICFLTSDMINPQWLKLPMSITNLYGPKDVRVFEVWLYSKTCVRQPPLKLTSVVDVERWLSYKGTCHVILLAKLHDMYLYKTDNIFHINHYLKSVSKVAVLHWFYCMYDQAMVVISLDKILFLNISWSEQTV